MDCPPDRGQPRNQSATHGCESVVVKMTLERDSGVVAIWDWIARHGLILCRPSWLNCYAAVPRKGSTLPPLWVRSRKSAHSCIILALGSK